MPCLHHHRTLSRTFACMQMAQSGAHPVVAVKGLRVGEFNGKTLSSVGATVLNIDPPDLPETQRLRAWWVCKEY